MVEGCGGQFMVSGKQKREQHPESKAWERVQCPGHTSIKHPGTPRTYCRQLPAVLRMVPLGCHTGQCSPRSNVLMLFLGQLCWCFPPKYPQARDHPSSLLLVMVVQNEILVTNGCLSRFLCTPCPHLLPAPCFELF